MTFNQPLDLVGLCLGEEVLVKLRGNREVQGILTSYDEHTNLLITKAKETAINVTVDPNTNEEIEERTTRSIPSLFVRGDLVIIIAPPKVKQM
ncbi:u6 snRNA-associated sm-like protein lsm3 [Anaeramoeba flamelloides]|uniref:U6 snRNA-associated sm-like protein lsm3 n=1 Tax=Anaeramoeba flamelloides TaxID=1746091 RepID=A0AAV8ACJ4_9EUKA|nr:u6 snRNA-associated sm-like protein lsm3 [Anaeramoeba flamelloides]KAJ6249583.1 u6 snRNA-associated sm-like protein lsm3 [Anaeramoeba flamelloides]